MDVRVFETTHDHQPNRLWLVYKPANEDEKAVSLENIEIHPALGAVVAKPSPLPDGQPRSEFDFMFSTVQAVNYLLNELDYEQLGVERVTEGELREHVVSTYKGWHVFELKFKASYVLNIETNVPVVTQVPGEGDDPLSQVNYVRQPSSLGRQMAVFQSDTGFSSGLDVTLDIIDQTLGLEGVLDATKTALSDDGGLAVPTGEVVGIIGATVELVGDTADFQPLTMENYQSALIVHVRFDSTILDTELSDYRNIAGSDGAAFIGFRYA